MAVAQLVQLPTAMNVDHAWAEYQALAIKAAQQPALMGNIHFAQEYARAWARWRDLFLALEEAA